MADDHLDDLDVRAFFLSCDTVVAKSSAGAGELFFKLSALRAFRCAAGISQQRLAVLASQAAGRDIWPKTVGALERLERGARERTVLALAVALGIRFADLFRPLADDERQALQLQLADRFRHD
jgi:transcriptional regulator with XRE-family HTH domain